MSWELLALIISIILIIVLIVFRKTSFVKKTWKYSLILAPLIIFLILKILSGRKSSASGNGGSSTGNTKSKESDNLEIKIGKLNERLQEVQQEVAIEVSAAKTKNEEKIKELEEVKKIEDKKERRRRLADLVG
jgi:hypothetical protein